MNDLLSLCIVKLSAPSARASTSVQAIIDEQHRFGCTRIMEVITEYANSAMSRMSVANEESFDDHWELDFASLAKEPVHKVYLNMRFVNSEHTEWELWVNKEEADHVFYSNLREFVCSKAT